MARVRTGAACARTAGVAASAAINSALRFMQPA
jgi:hypothetical protein